MSTLTKILIVLLALSSIFLSGIVVTYVGTANNYKKLADDQRRDIQSLGRQKEDLEATVNEKNDTIAKNKEISDSALLKLQQENDTLTVELTTTKDALDAARVTMQNAVERMDSYSKTVEKNTQARKQAEEEAVNLKAQNERNENKINQLTDQIVAKNAIIDRLEGDKKQLVEEKTKIQNELDKYLQLASQRSYTQYPVTASSGSVMAAPAIKDIDLEGVIVEVKPEDSLASISIGSAHGVKDRMKFHVIRNNSFICDIVITKIDADRSSGYLDLVTAMPKAGDVVKTNF